MDPNAAAQVPQLRPYPQWPEKYSKYGDFTLETSDHYRFPVSRGILSRENVVFAQLFDGCENGVSEAFLPDISGDGLFELLMFIYEGKTTGTLPNVVDQVYCAAEKFNVAALKTTCEEQLANQLSVDSICVTVDLAKKFGLNGLLSDSLFFIRDHREDPHMPWGHLGKFCIDDGKFLKEMVMVAADDSHVPHL